MKAYEFTSKATGDVYVTEGADMQAAYDALPESFDKTAGTLAYALEAATSSEVAAEIVAKASAERETPATDRAVARYVARGGAEDEGRYIIEQAIARDYGLAADLWRYGFTTAAHAERVAAEIIAEARS